MSHPGFSKYVEFRRFRTHPLHLSPPERGTLGTQRNRFFSLHGVKASQVRP